MTRAVLLAAAVVALIVLACAPPPKRAAEIDPLGPNAACYVCHMTFVREELSKTHLAAEVGCIQCHGLSAPHANDEDIGATKPDIVFQRADINPACRKCHPTHDVPPGQVLARWEQRRAAGLAPKAAPPASAACTDCHGQHRIARQPNR